MKIQEVASWEILNKDKSVGHILKDPEIVGKYWVWFHEAEYPEKGYSWEAAIARAKEF